jgi:UDP-2-acetamido-2-deoxy-ribo-hexuluronate aminotransferase
MLTDLEEELDLVTAGFRRVLDHRQYILGPEVVELENLLSRWLGTKHAIGCNSGFGANLLSLIGLGIGPGARVAISAFAPYPHVGTLMRRRALPILIDVLPEEIHMDPGQLADRANGKLDAIIVHHLFGGAAPIARLKEVAEGVPIVEVLTYSLGATAGEQKLGTFGTMATSCLREEGTLNAYGDAGMIWTDDDSLATSLRHIRAENSPAGIHEGPESGNFHQDTIHAAILLLRFDKWRREAEDRARRIQRLAQAIAGLGLCGIRAPAFYRHNGTHLVIFVDQRDQLVSHLNGKGIEAKPWWPVPIHLQPGFQQLEHRLGEFPQAERAARCSLWLPVARDDREIELCLDALKAFYRTAPTSSSLSS